MSMYFEDDDDIKFEDSPDIIWDKATAEIIYRFRAWPVTIDLKVHTPNALLGVDSPTASVRAHTPGAIVSTDV